MSSASPRNFLCSRTHSCAAHFFCALASVNHMDASNARRTPIVEPHDRLGGPDGLAHRLEEALHGRSSWVKCGLNHSRERGVTVAQRMPWPPQRGPGGPPGEVREARPGDPRPSDHHPGWCLQHPGWWTRDGCRQPTGLPEQPRHVSPTLFPHDLGGHCSWLQWGTWDPRAPPQDLAHTTVARKGREQQRRRLRRRPPGAAAPGGVVVPGLFLATVVCARSWGRGPGTPRPPL